MWGIAIAVPCIFLWQIEAGSGIIKMLMLLVDRRIESNRRLKYRLLYMEQRDGKNTAYKVW